MTKQDSKKLFTFEFVTLNLVIFFAFCNLAVFYSFFSYLERIGIPAYWRGFLVGLEPMSAFVLRLAAIPMLHAGNAAAAMLNALSMIVTALCSYGWVTTIPGLAALRIFHGAAFVLLVSAGMALVVHFIPKEKSGQGFGFVSLSTLVPYAVMPLLSEVLLGQTQNEAHMYRAVTVLAAPAFVLLFLLRKRLKRSLGSMDRALVTRPKPEEIRRDLQDPRIVILLAVNFFLYLCYAFVFYFMKSFDTVNSMGRVGSFFTISTLVIIALRLPGGFFFDKVDKTRMLQVAMFLLVTCFVLFGVIKTGRELHQLACYYGLCIGLITPLLNSLLFNVSTPHLRGVTTNLALFAMDAGFSISPYAGGAFIASGHSFATLFDICAGVILVNVGLLIVFQNLKKRAFESSF